VVPRDTVVALGVYELLTTLIEGDRSPPGR
jgi:hypothetical protein